MGRRVENMIFTQRASIRFCHSFHNMGRTHTDLVGVLLQTIQHFSIVFIRLGITNETSMFFHPL